MKVWILRYEHWSHGEHFTRSVHLTHKGALLKRVQLLLEVLMDLEWEQDDWREITYIDQLHKTEASSSNTLPIALVEEHGHRLSGLAECVEVYTHVEQFTLEP